MAAEECLRDHQVDDGVTQVLEALVVGACLVGMLVQEAAVDERLLDEADVANREPEAFGEGGRRAHRVCRAMTRGRRWDGRAG